DELDLNELLDGLQPVFESMCDLSIDLRVRRAGYPVRVRCNAHLLENAVINLVLNAHEAIAGHGSVTVEVSRIQELSEATDAQDVSRAVITVSDTGCGMTVETMNRAFTPFYTSKPAGTGLGLTMTRLFAASIGGRVEVQSILGSGTAFSLV